MATEPVGSAAAATEAVGSEGATAAAGWEAAATVVGKGGGTYVNFYKILRNEWAKHSKMAEQNWKKWVLP